MAVGVDTIRNLRVCSGLYSHPHTHGQYKIKESGMQPEIGAW